MNDPTVVMVIDEMLAWARSGETTGGMVSTHVLATLADEIESLRKELYLETVKVKSSEARVEFLEGKLEELEADNSLLNKDCAGFADDIEKAEADSKVIREALEQAIMEICAMMVSVMMNKVVDITHPKATVLYDSAKKGSVIYELKQALNDIDTEGDKGGT